ncbi:MAG: FG-GAP-like repeat-containing protein [Edaphobacter sp.]
MKTPNSPLLWSSVVVFLFAISPLTSGAQSVAPSDQQTPQTPYERIVVPGMKSMAGAHAEDTRRSVPAAAPSSAAPPPNFGGFVAAPKFVAADLSNWDSRTGGLSVFAVGDFNHDGKPDLATVQASGEVNVILNQTPATGTPIAFSAPISRQINTVEAAQVLAIDVNGDGYDDLVVLDTDSTTNYLDVLINQKDGTFAPPIQVGKGNPHTAGVFAMADLNGDGHPDLLLLSSSFTLDQKGHATATTLEFDTYLNDGNGNFLTPGDSLKQVQNYTGEYLALRGRSIVLTDVNNDGKLDATVELLQVLPRSDTPSPHNIIHVVMTMPGTGTGAFQTPSANATITIHSGATANIGFPLVAHLNVVDINGDGVKDIVFSYQDYSIYAALGNGDGTYKTPHNVGLPGAYPTDLWVADLNGDGVQDLVDAEPAYLVIYPGHGDGTFDLPTVRHYGSGLGKSAVLSVADFNGDGLPDAALMNSFEGSATIFRSLAGAVPAVFAAPLLQKSASSAYIQRVQAQTVLDANGDGNDDIFFASRDATLGNPLLVTALGDGKGNFSNVNAVPEFEENKFDYAEDRAADFNGDGRPDIVLHTTSQPVLLLSNGDGTFTPKPISLESDFSCSTNYAASGDVNGDGKLDLVIAYEGDPIHHCNTGSILSGFYVLLGNGDGTFQPAKFRALGGLLFQPVLIDLNGDGKLDLVISDDPYPPAQGNFATYILLGNGDGTFGYPTAILPFYLNSLTLAGDVNGDGHPDLVVVNQGLTNSQKDSPDLSQSGALVMLGDGAGNFTLSSQFLKGFFGPGALIDLNGDGKLDLLLSEVAVFDFNEPFAGGVVGLGNGDGTFTAVGNYEAGTGSPIVLPGNFLKGNAPSAAFVSGDTGTTLLIAQGGTVMTVTPGPGNIPAGATANFNVSLTPTLTGRPAPTGTVTLREGATTLASGTLSNGAAIIAVDGLPVGSHAITAAYSGDSNYNLNSGQTSLVVTPAPSFALTASAMSLSLTKGQTGVLTLTALANASFSGTVTITASGGPAGVSVVVNPGTLTLQAGQSALASVVVSTVGPKNARSVPPSGVGPGSQLAMAGTGLALFLLVPLRRRNPIRLLMSLGALALSLTAVGSIFGCNGSNNSHYTVASPGSAMITVTATPSNSSIPAQTVSISVTVN